ncbi:hypothetical protein [Algoriphagus mannitolivorans]|uniref:hypothetical protein n=1 Tax=Algoriphagus mannitolivorans TaxID=226504 RepID=UPI000412F583|nr:hypothetical protein [Algoriphagus mannitolivorans]
MRVGLIMIFFLGFFAAQAQKTSSAFLGTPIFSHPIPNLDLVSLDTKDQIFASNTSGDIYLIDSRGKQLNFFSPSRQGQLSQLEASWTVNIFGFSTDLQEYRILDRFLNPLVEKGLFDTGITLAKAATLGNNNVLWIWDESDLSLKSLNYLQNQIIQTQPLNLILDSPDLTVMEIREFKNRLFMNVPNSGIYIFDNQGNFLQKVDLQLNQRLCFYKENLYWVEGKKLKRYSLTHQEIFEIGDLPSSDYLYLQIGQQILTLVRKDQIEVYPIPRGLNP